MVKENRNGITPERVAEHIFEQAEYIIFMDNSDICWLFEFKGRDIFLKNANTQSVEIINLQDGESEMFEARVIETMRIVRDLFQGSGYEFDFDVEKGKWYAKKNKHSK